MESLEMKPQHHSTLLCELAGRGPDMPVSRMQASQMQISQRQVSKIQVSNSVHNPFGA